MRSSSFVTFVDYKKVEENNFEFDFDLENPEEFGISYFFKKSSSLCGRSGYEGMIQVDNLVKHRFQRKTTKDKETTLEMTIDSVKTKIFNDFTPNSDNYYMEKQWNEITLIRRKENLKLYLNQVLIESFMAKSSPEKLNILTNKCVEIAKFNIYGFKKENIRKRVKWSEGVLAQNDQENGVSFTMDNDGAYKSEVIPELNEWNIEFNLKINFEAKQEKEIFSVWSGIMKLIKVIIKSDTLRVSFFKETYDKIESANQNPLKLNRTETKIQVRHEPGITRICNGQNCKEYTLQRHVS